VARRLIPALLFACAAASCLLPEAQLVGSGGGDTTSSTGSSTSSTSTGPFTVTPPQPTMSHSVVLPISGPSVLAPSGNPGQRHLVRAGGRWYAFYITGGGISYRASDDLETWQNEIFAFNFDFGGAADGRNFGVDVQSVGGSDVLHFSLSTSSGNKVRAHARAVVPLGSSPIFDKVANSSTPGISSAPDGTISVIARAPDHTVFDFAAADPSCFACVTASDSPETGVAPGPSFGSPAGIDASSGPIRVRSALALDSGTMLFWRSSGTLRASSNKGAGWAPAYDFPAITAPDDARVFASCVQPANPGPGTVGHLVWWSASGPRGFQHRTVDVGFDQKVIDPPEGGIVQGSQAVSDLVLACGMGRVHAFLVDPANPRRILGATWDVQQHWTGWSTVLEHPGDDICYLTAFDQATSGAEPSVGLLWSEAKDCATPGITRLWSARVRVDDI
jgi:hypothetical protein